MNVCLTVSPDGPGTGLGYAVSQEIYLKIKCLTIAMLVKCKAAASSSSTKGPSHFTWPASVREASHSDPSASASPAASDWASTFNKNF